MVTKSYDIGDKRRLQATFTDVNGTLGDPTALELKIKAPDGTFTTKSLNDIERESVGVFYFDHIFLQSGRHIASWSASAGIVTSGEVEYYVRKKGVV